jgi:hypothetical protein
MTKCAKMRCNGPGPHRTSDVRPAVLTFVAPLCGVLLVGGAHEKTATLHCCVCRVTATERMSLKACLLSCDVGFNSIDSFQGKRSRRCVNLLQCCTSLLGRNPIYTGNAPFLPS